MEDLGTNEMALDALRLGNPKSYKL